MSIPELPLEIIIEIGLKNPWTWRALLAIPNFARWTLTKHAQKMKCNLIVKKKSKYATEFYLGTKLHNFDNLPARISDDGEKYWCKHGLFHRENDLPARTTSWRGKVSNQYWYQNGQMHRDNDRPAKMKWNGAQYWYQYGLLHRDNDMPAVKNPFGETAWYQHGIRHRDKGPAVIEYDEHKYYKNGKKTYSRKVSNFL